MKTHGVQRILFCALLLGLGACAVPVSGGGSPGSGPSAGKGDSDRAEGDYTEEDIETLRAAAYEMAWALYEGHPGIPAMGTGSESIDTLRGNAHRAVDATAAAIMDAGGPAEIRESLNTFSEISSIAIYIYDRTHPVAEDLFSDPVVADAYAWLAGGSADPYLLANAVAGSLAGSAFGIGRYVPITGDPDTDERSIQHYGREFRRNMWEAEQRMEAFIAQARSGEIQERLDPHSGSDDGDDGSDDGWW